MLKFTTKTILLLSTLLVTSTAFSAENSGENLYEEISAYNDRYNEIAASYDLSAFIELYNDTPLWIAPDVAPVEGLDVPRNTFGFIIENKGNLVHSFDHLEVSDDGSQAVMIGQYDAEIAAVGSKSTGTYLFVLKRDGDAWKIVVDMFNQHAEK